MWSTSGDRALHRHGCRYHGPRRPDAIYQVLSGGLALGAFYMATDYTTTPMTPKGKIIFGIGCGVITALVRLFASALRAWRSPSCS